MKNSLLPFTYDDTTLPSPSRDEILMITSYPPRECGIATYSQDLIKALNHRFSSSLAISVCALESNGNTYPYPSEVKYTLKTNIPEDYTRLTAKINENSDIKIVVIQHEFGFYHNQEQAFLKLLYTLTKPVVIVFHTVLPEPDSSLQSKIVRITTVCDSIIVMTNSSSSILVNDYGVRPEKITVIAHGTHLVPHLSEKFLKNKYGLTGRKVLTTFGLLSSGKGIETTLEALPAIIESHPDVVFLLIGKTHPEVVKSEGEIYREMLEQKVEELSLQEHVVFINNYLALPELLDYLQLTDIYLFTANDRNQAVSGTFAYAMSCACPIISTPIPHAMELLTTDTGIIFDFHRSDQLAEGVVRLLNDEALRRNMSSNTLEKIISSAWENSAVAHSLVFEKITGINKSYPFRHPEINLDHLRKMTSETGIIQFSKINQPDILSGYTLDDNARALVAMCMYFQQSNDQSILPDIRKYLDFIRRCQQPGGNFLNYVDKELRFTEQNFTTNLDDANGRAIWAIGYVLSLGGLLPRPTIDIAHAMITKSLLVGDSTHSTRAMAFVIKGLYYDPGTKESKEKILLLRTFADRLVQMYRHESHETWEWFESYVTYANSILPEAMLNAWLITGEPVYKEIAVASFDFLISQTFTEKGIEVISNRTWLHKGGEPGRFGEQPIDVAYTVMTLSRFYDELHSPEYHTKMNTAFNWFLGSNRLNQIIYNPCTGGCYDGLEETHVNLNQGAESTVSYLLARLTIEKYKNTRYLQNDENRNQIIRYKENRSPIYSNIVIQ